jgi:uncharacterized protein YkwD
VPHGKLSSLFAIAILVVLALAPDATAAARLGEQRVAPKPKPSPAPPQHDGRDHGLIAPVDACANQTSTAVPLPVQRRAMRCMTNYARRGVGMAGLGKARQLDRSASGKSRDILRCDSFSHFACGRDFTYWMRQSGYLAASCWRAGENLAWGMGDAGSVRAVFRAWMSSPGHRDNILGRFRQIGVGVRVGNLDGHDAHVWTQHFGSHC